MGDIADVDYLVMVNLSSMMLRGLAEILQQPRNLAAAWAPIAEQALQEEGALSAVEKEIASWKTARE